MTLAPQLTLITCLALFIRPYRPHPRVVESTSNRNVQVVINLVVIDLTDRYFTYVILS